MLGGGAAAPLVSLWKVLALQLTPLSSWVQGGGEGEGAGKLANLRPSWRVKPGLNPVYYSDTSAEWLEQEMLLR